MDSLPDYLSQVDKIYITWSPPLSVQGSLEVGELRDSYGAQLDEKVLPVYERFQKPIIIGIGYPSVDNAAAGCVMISDHCESFNVLDQPTGRIAGVSIDMEEQAVIYEAVLESVNQKDWVSGFVSRGYYPPVGLEDYSSSIRMKPAEDIVSYWFHELSASSTE